MLCLSSSKSFRWALLTPPPDIGPSGYLDFWKTNKQNPSPDGIHCPPSRKCLGSQPKPKLRGEKQTCCQQDLISHLGHQPNGRQCKGQNPWTRLGCVDGLAVSSELWAVPSILKGKSFNVRFCDILDPPLLRNSDWIMLLHITSEAGQEGLEPDPLDC